MGSYPRHSRLPFEQLRQFGWPSSHFQKVKLAKVDNTVGVGAKPALVDLDVAEREKRGSRTAQRALFTCQAPSHGSHVLRKLEVLHACHMDNPLDNPLPRLILNAKTTYLDSSFSAGQTSRFRAAFDLFLVPFSGYQAM
jgi:hypothetical protein